MIKLLLKTFFTSLLASHLLSWIYILNSNITLGAQVKFLAEQGYLVLPAGPALEALYSPMSAFGGAFFFALTAGVFVTWICILLWVLLLYSRIDAIIPWGISTSITRTNLYIALWSITTLILNFKNFSWIMASHTLIIPLVVLPVLKKMSKHSFSIKKNYACIISFLISLMVTMACFFSLADQGIFLRTRDYLLLSNPPGRIINQMYYQYTPYAAEAIKPDNKKQIKSCWIDPEIRQSSPVKKILSNHGWLSTTNRAMASLIIKQSNHSRIILSQGNQVILNPGQDDFLKNPHSYLKQYAALVDNMAAFRFLCLAGLILGVPVFFFSMVFFFISRIFLCKNADRLWWRYSPKVSSLTTGILTTMLFVMVLFYLTPPDVGSAPGNIQKGLKDRSTRKRIQALRTIVKTKADIFDYMEYQFPVPGLFPDIKNNTKKLIPGNDAEKYWLANALGVSHDKKAIPVLKKLMEDSAINVQCAAIKALSRKMPGLAFSSIFIKKIKTSPHWYVQQAAYRAIKP